MKYRRKIEVVADVLSAAQERTKKTHIMYRGNLSYKVLNVYLGAVTKANLVGFDEATGSYMITEKGRMFLAVFKKYKRLVSLLERRYSSVKKEQTLLEKMCFAADLPNKNALFNDRVDSVRGN
jgi:predicted transcriptional regulator